MTIVQVAEKSKILHIVLVLVSPHINHTHGKFKFSCRVFSWIHGFCLAGLYYCHASNSLGEGSCHLELTGELWNIFIFSYFLLKEMIYALFHLFMTSQGEQRDRPGAG